MCRVVVRCVFVASVILKEESVTLATKERSFVDEPLFPDKARIYAATKKRVILRG